MGGITCNAEGFAGETGAVDVLEGGERDTNDLLSCSHYPLKGLAAGRVAGAIPHSDAASQDALDGASVEGAHDGGRGSGSSEFYYYNLERTFPERSLQVIFSSHNHVN